MLFYGRNILLWYKQRGWYLIENNDSHRPLSFYITSHMYTCVLLFLANRRRPSSDGRSWYFALMLSHRRRYHNHLLQLHTCFIALPAVDVLLSNRCPTFVDLWSFGGVQGRAVPIFTVFSVVHSSSSSPATRVSWSEGGARICYQR